MPGVYVATSQGGTNPASRKKASSAQSVWDDVVHIQQKPLAGSLKSIRPLTSSQVRRTPSEKLFSSLIHQYQYLNYCQPVGEHLNTSSTLRVTPIACMAWSSAPRHIKARARTRKNLMLDDAGSRGIFKDDPYILNNATKSILCVPIIHQNKSFRP